ncbi:MAG: hypothetical protein KAX19_01770 [Candidatus Brocadiae bacterium]|nr:hypothetical protein [Candidatus Brocadiia bacterium]
MVHETSTFDSWIRNVEQSTDGTELVQALDVIATDAAETYGARLWFAEVLGRRWSYIGGYRSEAPTELAVKRISLGADIGLVADDWGAFSSCECTRLLGFLRDLVSLKRRL